MPTPLPRPLRPHSLGPVVPLALASVLEIACGSSSGPGPTTTATTTEARSAASRITTPVVSPSDAAQVASGNRAFAVDLHQTLRDMPGNLVYSPASISIAMAMLYGGTAGMTEAEIAQALHFDLPPERLHPAFDALDLALEAPPVSGAAFRLTVANALWAQRDQALLSTYLDLLAENYGAGVRLVDFAGDREGARGQINQWVADQTDQSVPELLDPTAPLDDRTRLVLTNAVYFNADWQMPFQPKSTNSTFHTAAGDVSVPMMRGPDSLPIWSGDGFVAAALAYVGGTTSMIVIVPDQGTFDAFEQGLTGDRLGAILDAAGGAQLGAVTLPRFKFTTKIDLRQALQALGVKQAFDQVLADLSGIDGERDLFVKDVLHQATIAVDEKGTEAAAATAVIIGRKAATMTSLLVDRPFLFLIRNDATGAILFQGRVSDPTQ